MYVSFFMGIFFFICFLIVAKRASEALQETEELRQEVKNIYAKISDIERGSGYPERKSTARKTTSDEDARIARSATLYAKYDALIYSITESINARRYQTYDLFYRDVFSPKEWRENTMGNRETWFALYDYYNKLLPLLIEWKSAQPLVNEVCEEAYRLTGFLGINLNDQNSDIMSYMCDVEQSANGKSQRLTTICKKLDSIGALDRGQPFGNRLR